MEGPSLYLAAEQLKPFVGKRIESVRGNTKIGKERIEGLMVRDIFSWGKHLVFQFDGFAMRIHFMLLGTFEATVKDKPVTGDYKKKAREPRLALTFKNGHIETYSCSIKYVEEADAKASYDYSIDVMSGAWDEKIVLKKVVAGPDREIDDVLLDQTIFAGVGNIIKNEVLWLQKVHPEELIGNLSRAKLKSLTKEAHDFSWQFLAWRREFVLLKNLQIYRKGKCLRCGAKVVRGKTGKGQRGSFYCPKEQVLKK